MPRFQIAGKEMSCFKYNDFVTSVAYYPESSNVFLSGTSSNGIFATDSRSGKVHMSFYTTLRSSVSKGRKVHISFYTHCWSAVPQIFGHCATKSFLQVSYKFSAKSVGFISSC